jgi:hypothetical protein
MIQKIIDFFIKKELVTVTGTMTQTSKTKIFITLMALCQAVEFASPYFGHAIVIPKSVYEILATMAGIAYAGRATATTDIK